MIANEATPDVWTRLAAPLPPDAIQWRQDGKPTARDGKYSARFVAFIDAQFVRERFDAVVAGDWDLLLEPLPPRVTFEGEEEREPYAFKARLVVLGVTRESVGQGKDYKTAETDAFKRAAVRFGVAAELYAFGPNWVPVDGDGRYAKPLEDPGTVYARRRGGSAPAHPPVAASASPASARTTTPVASPASTNGVPGETARAASGDEESCPKCAGRMWDNRIGKRNPKAPDFKCRDRACDGVIWPEKAAAAPRIAVPSDDEDAPPIDDDDLLPF